MEVMTYDYKGIYKNSYIIVTKVPSSGKLLCKYDIIESWILWSCSAFSPPLNIPLKTDWVKTNEFGLTVFKSIDKNLPLCLNKVKISLAWSR